MKLLLDENLPKRLKKDFSDHNVFTVSDKGWNSKKNGELLKLMLADNFDVLITFDQNIQHQQNFDKYPIAVLVLVAENNTYPVLTLLSAQINKVLAMPVRKGTTVIQ